MPQQWAVMEEQSSAAEAPQFYEVVVMDGNKTEEDVMNTSADGITVTLKDSTTDEDVPMSVSTSEGILMPQNVVSQGDIQIAELQTGEVSDMAVVYTSASEMPQVTYVSQAMASSEAEEMVMREGEEHGVQQRIVVQGNDGNQQIMIGEVQSLPQEVQATILNSIQEIQAVPIEGSLQEVSESMDDAGKDDDETLTDSVEVGTLQSGTGMRNVSSITTCSRSDQQLEDMVPPQILATEDDPEQDDIPMESVDQQNIQQTVDESINQRSVTELPSSEEDQVLEGTVITEVDVSEGKAGHIETSGDEVSMAKFAPLMLSPVKAEKQSEDIPMDKPRIVSISHGRAGSEGNGQMEVPNFMDGTDGDEVTTQEGISLVQGGAAILTSIDGVSVSQTYTIVPPTSAKLQGGSAEGDSKPPKSLLADDGKSGDKKPGASSTGKSTSDGKPKGKKGKNEMLHGMQLLSECAMALENQDDSQEEEEEALEKPGKESVPEEGQTDGAQPGATADIGDEMEAGDISQLTEEVIVDEEPMATIEEVAAIGDVQGLQNSADQILENDGPSISVENGNGAELTVSSAVVEQVEVTETVISEADLNLQQPVEGGELVQAEVAVTAHTVQATTEVVVTSEGQVLKAVAGANFVPLEIGNHQEVIIDSQQISEELIPMVQEEVILEIVEGDQIIMNDAGASNEQIVTNFYEDQAIAAGNKAYNIQQLSTVQDMIPMVAQPGMPSSYRPQTYSQELKSAKRKSKKKSTKRKKNSSPGRSAKHLKTEPSSPSDGGGKQKYQCHVCQKLFEKMKELRDHLLVHYNTKGYVCDFCNKTFASSSHLRRHVMIHTGERPHKCDYCGDGFIQAVQLRVHKQRHDHGPAPPLSRAPPKRKESGESSSGGSPEKQVRKRRKRSSKPAKAAKGEKYQCPICKIKHKSKRKIKAHMKCHVTAKSFKCGHCPDVFANKNQLTIHEARHKGKPELQCAYCGKNFDTTSHLKRHERIHTGEKPYKCQFCEKCFIQGVQLRLHERIHTGDRPHICNVCNKSFARTQYLKRHSCIHTGEKPLQCRFCLDRFVQPVQRQQHEKKLHKKKLKKLLAQKQKPGQPPIKLVLRLKKKKGRKGDDEVTDSDESDTDDSESSDEHDSN